MIAEPAHRALAVRYLVLYNAAFTTPLLAVFLLTILGVTSQQLARWSGRHVAAVKLGMLLLFLSMAAVVLYNVTT